MIAVIFEVWPAPGHKDDYLAIAASLRDELSQIDGFISVERFQSITEPGKALVAVVLARRGGGEAMAYSGPSPRKPGERP